jgi:hypothetical protein
MNSDHDILAQCLAAQDHPHLADEPEFLQAKAALDASPELQDQLQEARRFLEAHPVLVDTTGMPADVRERISRTLREQAGASTPAGKQILGPWQIRRQFAWAASLVLLLAGMAVLSSSLMDRQYERNRQIALQLMRPQDAFRSEIGHLVNRRLNLQERSDSATQLVSWLGERGMENIHAPTALMENPTLGCAQFDAPFGKIGVVCFDVNGEVVHLFVACARAMGLKEVRSPEKFNLQGREAMQWSDQENLYLLIPHEADAALPEIFL